MSNKDEIATKNASIITGVPEETTFLQNEFNKILNTLRTSQDPLMYYELGRLYELGNGVKIDKEQAAIWYQLALKQLDVIERRAQQGEAQAQFVYGRILK